MISVYNLPTAQDLVTKGVSCISFCDEKTIDELLREFDLLHPERNELMQSGYYFSIFGGNRKYRRAIFENLYPILEPHLTKLFNNFKAISVVAQIKGVGRNSAVILHQDLTVVDETKHRSWTVWIPLQESTEANGPLSFLEYSHVPFSNIRTHNIDYLFEEVEEYILFNSNQYLAKKGEALIFDAATIHHSGPNFSSEPRLSIALTIIEDGVDTEIFHFDRLRAFDGSLQRYRVPNDFWLLYDDFKKQRLLPPEFGTMIGRQFGAQVLPYDKRAFISKHKEQCAKAKKTSSVN